eukprot:801243_1
MTSTLANVTTQLPVVLPSMPHVPNLTTTTASGTAQNMQSTGLAAAPKPLVVFLPVTQNEMVARGPNIGQLQSMMSMISPKTFTNIPLPINKFNPPMTNCTSSLISSQPLNLITMQPLIERIGRQLSQAPLVNQGLSGTAIEQHLLDCMTNA